MKSGKLNFLEPSGPLQTCNGTALPLKYAGRRDFKVQMLAGGKVLKYDKNNRQFT